MGGPPVRHRGSTFKCSALLQSPSLRAALTLSWQVALNDAVGLITLGVSIGIITYHYRKNWGRPCLLVRAAAWQLCLRRRDALQAPLKNMLFNLLAFDRCHHEHEAVREARDQHGSSAALATMHFACEPVAGRLCALHPALHSVWHASAVAMCFCLLSARQDPVMASHVFVSAFNL